MIELLFYFFNQIKGASYTPVFAIFVILPSQGRMLVKYTSLDLPG